MVRLTPTSTPENRKRCPVAPGALPASLVGSAPASGGVPFRDSFALRGSKLSDGIAGVGIDQPARKGLVGPDLRFATLSLDSRPDSFDGFLDVLQRCLAPRWLRRVHVLGSSELDQTPSTSRSKLSKAAPITSMPGGASRAGGFERRPRSIKAHERRGRRKGRLSEAGSHRSLAACRAHRSLPQNA